MSTVTSKSYVVAADQHHHDKGRKLLRLILVVVGVIVFLAALFLAVVIYRTWKTGADLLLLFSDRLQVPRFPVITSYRHTKEKFNKL